MRTTSMGHACFAVRCFFVRGLVAIGCLWMVLVPPLGPTPASGGEITHRDGRKIEGKFVRVPQIAAEPVVDKEGSRPVVFIDDELRRVFIPWRLVDGVAEGAGEALERITLDQHIPGGGAPVAGVGTFIKVDPWDDWGRRTVKMNATGGPQDIIQGMVLITPYYTQVSAIRNFQWDMRIATSSIPIATLRKILTNHKVIEPKNLQSRSQLVRFYLQARRFKDAKDELENLIKDFPEAKETHKGILRDITQLGARTLLAEIEKWRSAGQYQRAFTALRKFPDDQVAGEVLQQVQKNLDDLRRLNDQLTAVKDQFQDHVKVVDNPRLQAQLLAIRDEILAELNFNTLDRMASYQQFSESKEMLAEQKVAFAISGWLLGSKSADDNLSVAISLHAVRGLVQEYCAEPTILNRNLILQKLMSQEGATVQSVSQILEHMKPPMITSPTQNGFYELEAAMPAGEAPTPYLVQLPPEYDPYRKYPAVVSLHGGRTSAMMQLEWWAGAEVKAADDKVGYRFGQAGRHGYIVIAPAWGMPHQDEYGFTQREHLAVLNSLRDACRRFSIDTDRVYLSGHSMGGDAAWDIALAHPDLFAGAIPIVARARKYVDMYRQNARYMPLYCVGGQLDGNHLQQNTLSFDHYMASGYPLTVVEYRGRGHEDFSDEIQNLFDWMGRYRRDFSPREFTCHTLRRWDNYFWWAEFKALPDKFMVEPETWPPKKGTRVVEITGTIGANNNISVRSGAKQTFISLSPEFVNFQKPVKVTVDGVAKSFNVAPNMQTLLEDARGRADRQHPFWATIEVNGPRRGE